MWPVGSLKISKMKLLRKCSNCPDTCYVHVLWYIMLPMGDWLVPLPLLNKKLENILSSQDVSFGEGVVNCSWDSALQLVGVWYPTPGNGSSTHLCWSLLVKQHGEGSRCGSRLRWAVWGRIGCTFLSRLARNPWDQWKISGSGDTP